MNALGYKLINFPDHIDVYLVDKEIPVSDKTALEAVLDAHRAACPDEFEGVLHPVFEEDEIKLIVVGGCLGALVGFAQYILLFSGGI